MTPRRTFLKFIGLEGLQVWLARNEFLEINDEKPAVHYVKNDALKTVRKDYAGSPMRQNKFLNENLMDANKGFGAVFKWFLSKNPQKDEKKSDGFRLTTVKLPPLDEIRQDCLIWLGHAAFLMRLDSKWVLTDPCLTAPPLQERLADLPIAISDIRPLDYVLISHGHFDHLDTESLGSLTLKNVTALVPLRMSDLVTTMNKNIVPQEAAWYQEFTIKEKFKIFFLPAQHWYSRTPWDRNQILWGSFLITIGDKKIFFAGDTAYADHFKEIHELFGDIDLCLLPVGAYKPSYIMKPNHTNPEEAVRAFHDLHGTVLIPMHYGTFDLSDEPLGEPIRILRSMADERRIKGELKIPNVGEVVYL